MILKLCKLNKEMTIFYGGTKKEVKKIKSSFFGKNLIINSHVPFKEISNRLKKLMFVFYHIQKELLFRVMLETFLNIPPH